MVLIPQAFYLREDITGLEIDTRQVHRYRLNFDALLCELMKLPTNLLNDAEVKLCNPVRLFEHRHKNSRAQHALLRIYPPCQCLTSADPTGEAPHLRLIIRLNPALLDSLIKMHQHIITILVIMLYLAIVNLAGNGMIFTNVVLRLSRTVNQRHC